MQSAARTWDPYCGVAPEPAALWSQWNVDPLLLAAIGAGIAAWLLTLGRSASAGERVAFAAAMAAVIVAFVSPLCALSSALFSARVSHHLLTVAVAAPLLAVALRRTPTAGAAWTWLLAHAASLWLWHAPGPYAFALSSDPAYWLMQSTLLVPAVMFWRGVFAAQAPVAAGLLILGMMQMGLLGALITFAGQPLYAPHLATTAPWGLTPLEDQQIAGLIMWAPASMVYLFAALAAGWAWLGDGRRPLAA